MCYVHPGSIYGPTRVDPGALQGRSQVPTGSLPSPYRVSPEFNSKSILGPYRVDSIFMCSCTQHSKIHLIFL